jgi:hypothetical protein
LLSAVLLASCWFGWRRAQDRFGLLATLAGSGSLLVYTCFTGFTYGWQKTAQFGGVFVTAMFLVVLIDALVAESRRDGWRRWVGGSALVLCGAFFVSAVAANLTETARWSAQKKLSIDWLDLKQRSASMLQESPVLIDAGSFRMPFFHGMWSAYFLTRSRIYYGNRDAEPGGYLRQHVLSEDALPGGRAAAVLVGQAWAATFDANSERLLDGREYVLLKASNRVADLQGVYPLNGVPEHAAAHLTFTLVPHSPSRFRLKLLPRIPRNWPEVAWRVTTRVGTGAMVETVVAGRPPWQFELPLAAAQSNTLEFTVVRPEHSPEALPFSIAELAVEHLP